MKKDLDYAENRLYKSIQNINAKGDDEGKDLKIIRDKVKEWEGKINLEKRKKQFLEDIEEMDFTHNKNGFWKDEFYD